MNNDNFEKQVSVNISLGHILAIWSVISDKLSCEPINKSFSEKEKRAIWALEDILEEELIKNKIEGRPEKEWNELVRRAFEYVKTLPVEFLD